MIKLIINGQRKYIPYAHELTTRQFIELTKLGENISIIQYISHFSGVPYSEIVNEKASNGLLKVAAALGKITDITNQKPTKHIKVGAKFVLAKELKHDTIGARIAYEQRIQTDKNTASVAVFFLASLLVENYDNEKAEEMYQTLLNEKAEHIIPNAVFFLKKLQNGHGNVLRTLTRIMRQALKMRITKWQAQTS